MIESIWLWIPCLLNALAENVGEIFIAWFETLKFPQVKVAAVWQNCLCAWCIRQPSSFLSEEINKQIFRRQMPIIHDLEICTFQAKHFSLICWVQLFNTYWIHWWVQNLKTSIKPWAKPCSGWSQGSWAVCICSPVLARNIIFIWLIWCCMGQPSATNKKKIGSSFWYFA